MTALWALLRGDWSAERAVPPQGATALLTTLAAGAMAVLAVFVLALALAAGRQAADWEAALSGKATVRVSASEGELEAQAATVETILAQTPGIGTTRRLTEAEQAVLLEPWFGADLPVSSLRLPVMIDVTLDGEGPDARGLAARLAAEAPGAVYDDHGSWRAPLVDAARGLRRLALVALLLIGAVTATTVALAASASLAANGQVIDVLRLVGAEDGYITRAFVRRFTLRALAGAAGGTLVGIVAVAILPRVSGAGPLADVGFRGAQWLWPMLVPFAAAALAYAATRAATARRLSGVS